MSAEFFRKYIDIINEFAPGSGSDSNGPMEYYLALKRMSEEYGQGEYNMMGGQSDSGQEVSMSYSSEQAESDAYGIMEVAEAFLKGGMEAGRQEFRLQDTAIREEMAEYLEGEGFDVRKDIYEL